MYLLLPAMALHEVLLQWGSAPQRYRNHTEYGSKTELRGYAKDPWELELTPALSMFLSDFT